MNPWFITTCVLAPAVGLLAGGYLYRKGEGLEDLREDLDDISASAKEWGWEFAPKFINEIRRHAFAEAKATLKAAAAMLRDPEKRREHFAGIYFKAFKRTMEEYPEEAQRYITFLKEWEIVQEAKRREASQVEAVKAELALKKQQQAVAAAATQAEVAAAAEKVTQQATAAA